MDGERNKEKKQMLRGCELAIDSTVSNYKPNVQSINNYGMKS